jgi:hypothetical protein
MTIGWPRSCDTLSTTTRLVVSEALPAGNGLMTLIGRVGQSCAQDAEPAKRNVAHNAPTIGRNSDTGVSRNLSNSGQNPEAKRALFFPPSARPEEQSAAKRQLIAAFAVG